MLINVDIIAKGTGHEIKFINSLKKLIRNKISEILWLLKQNNDLVLNNIINKKIFIEFFFVNDKTIQIYNQQLRGKNSPTNVLSLQYFSKEELLSLQPDIANLGTIFISLDTLKRESLESNTNIEEYFFKLVVHGLLHLLGYDHNNDSEAMVMHAMEQVILQKFDYKEEGLVKNYWW